MYGIISATLRVVAIMDGMDFRTTLTTLFTEVFEGLPPGEEGTWFVQRGEALEETLAALSAEQASVRLGSASSIAAHAIHATYYLQVSNAYGRGQTPEPDWAASWQRQEVTPEEWANVQAQLVGQKQQLLELMNQPELSDDDVFGAIVNIAHAAYHLGAIRQMVLATSPSSI